jgi:16S rRNA (uracil1498-N3)-methyltransferase
MNRFFVKPDDMTEDSAAIIGEDVKHISKVLRMQSGDRVMLSDGCGYEYLAEIETISRERVELKPAEPKQRITLYQGIPKAGKMELIIQKCVELGINGIIPVAAERSVVRVKPGEYRAKQPRYQRVACEAAKQSGRGIIPHIGELTTFKTADMSAYDLILVAYEDERQTSLKEVLRANMKAENIAVIIGPEGGLEIGEVESLINKGGKAVSLGRRILRTETAGMATVAMILYELEE